MKLELDRYGLEVLTPFVDVYVNWSGIILGALIGSLVWLRRDYVKRSR